MGDKNMDDKNKEVAQEYNSSLMDLTVNSKPLINMLTILAEENIEHGEAIVNAVEKHITKVEPEVKLPVLYLIDSIVKNVGREYITLFSKSIVSIFCGVFEKEDEKIRQKMFALRQTWNDVFPTQKLYTLDVKVNCMDPGWPITAKVKSKTPAIHVNPNFFNKEKDMKDQLLNKQRELLELQKRKLELELAATKKHIEEQEKQLKQTAASIKPSVTTFLSRSPSDVFLMNDVVIKPKIVSNVNIFTNKSIMNTEIKDQNNLITTGSSSLPLPSSTSINTINNTTSTASLLTAIATPMATLNATLNQEYQPQQKQQSQINQHNLPSLMSLSTRSPVPLPIQRIGPRIAPVYPPLIAHSLRDPRLLRQMNQQTGNGNGGAGNIAASSSSIGNGPIQRNHLHSTNSPATEEGRIILSMLQQHQEIIDNEEQTIKSVTAVTHAKQRIAHVGGANATITAGVLLPQQPSSSSSSSSVILNNFDKDDKIKDDNKLSSTSNSALRDSTSRSNTQKSVFDSKSSSSSSSSSKLSSSSSSSSTLSRSRGSGSRHSSSSSSSKHHTSSSSHSSSTKDSRNSHTSSSSSSIRHKDDRKLKSPRKSSNSSSRTSNNNNNSSPKDHHRKLSIDQLSSSSKSTISSSPKIPTSNKNTLYKNNTVTVTNTTTTTTNITSLTPSTATIITVATLSSSKATTSATTITTTTSPSNREHLINNKSPKFKDIKISTKSRNYIRRNRSSGGGGVGVGDDDAGESFSDENNTMDSSKSTLSNNNNNNNNNRQISSSSVYSNRKIILLEAPPPPSMAMLNHQDPTMMIKSLSTTTTTAAAGAAAQQQITAGDKSQKKDGEKYKNIDDMNMDVDLRIVDVTLPITTDNTADILKIKSINDNNDTDQDVDMEILSTPPSTTNTTTTTTITNDLSNIKPMGGCESTKKRLSSLEEDHSKNDDQPQQPLAKKSKSEKIDVLFGTEDIDLREIPQSSTVQTMNKSNIGTIEPPPPPMISSTSVVVVGSSSSSSKSNNVKDLEKNSNQVDWSNIKDDVICTKNKLNTIQKKSNLDVVRAKLAEAKKVSKQNRDLDQLRIKQQQQQQQQQQNLLNHVNNLQKQQQQLSNIESYDENSQDEGIASDATIKMIISQAKDQLDTKQITPEQYNTLIKQVISIKETQKLTEEQRQRDNKQNVIKQKRQRTSKWSPWEGKTTGGNGIQPQIIQPWVMNNNNHNITAGDSRLTSRNCLPPHNQMPIINNIWQHQQQPQSQEMLSGTSSPSSSSILPITTPSQMGGFNNQMLMKSSNIPSLMDPMMIVRQVPPVVVPPTAVVAAASAAILPIMPMPVIQPPIIPSLQPQQPNTEITRTITIDGIARELRFYDEIAIAFMNGSGFEPKEIGFQAGERRITIDHHEQFILEFNAPYKPFKLDNQIHQIRFGTPIRELYIDRMPFECYFGGEPAKIKIDGSMHIFQIDGPAPQVRIGCLRTDLVVGKIDMYLDGPQKTSLFLDAHIQAFFCDNQNNTIQFADFLMTILINNEPVPIEFGGMPKRIRINGSDHFIRFSTLPNGIVPGKIIIKNMLRTNIHRDLKSPPPMILLPPPPALPNILNMTNIGTPSNQQMSIGGLVTGGTLLPFIDNNISDTMTQNKNIDSMFGKPITTSALTNIISTTSNAMATANTISNTNLSNLEIPKIDIRELYNKLISTGIIVGGGGGGGGSSTNNSTNPLTNDNKQKPIDVIVDDDNKPKPIILTQPETLKLRQKYYVNALYSGMQCSSCGVRFPPEQTMKYSQHLDWHFRQNRRERDSIKRAQSRKWYYNVSDWIQYEEIEDLDDREKNWFETQQAAAAAAAAATTASAAAAAGTGSLSIGGILTSHGMECNDTFGQNSNDSNHLQVISVGGGGGNGGNGSMILISCVAGSNEDDKLCTVCHDPFETFYNEDTEDWHLRNAIRMDEKTYHPICYEDHMTSLNKPKEVKKFNNDDNLNFDDDNAVDIPIKAEDSEIVTKIILDDDDDDVIEIPQEEPIITEIPDDDDDDDDDHNALMVRDTTIISISSENKSIDQSTECITINQNENGKDVNENDKDRSPLAQSQSINDNNDETARETIIEDNDNNKDNENNESDVQILEPQISIMDLDEIDDDEYLQDKLNGIDTSAVPPVIVKIKSEPIDDGYKDENDAFEDIGTFEIIDMDSATIDLNTMSPHSNPIITTTTTTTTSTLIQPQITSMDGNIEPPAIEPLSTMPTNKIRINIAKGNVIKLNLNSHELNTNKYNNTIISQQTHDQAQPLQSIETIESTTNSDKNSEPNISFEFKESMRKIKFKKQPPKINGHETSGLCSIM